MLNMQPCDYFLRDHIFFCVTESFCFILDLKRDRYLSVNSRDFQILGTHLYGWPAARDVGALAGSALSPKATALAAELLEAGILSADGEESKEARPTMWKLPTDTLLNYSQRVSSFYCASLCANFFKAVTRTNQQLKRASLESIIRSIARRKETYARVAQPFDYDAAAKLAIAFGKLRPVFPRNHVCLFDSIALIEFLAQFNIFPTLVFGVRPEPFGAHCWVQAADVALNDTAEYTSEFTPIMAI
jgi:hypothetical protein